MTTDMASIADSEVVRLLQEGIAAAERGDKPAARDLLSQVVEVDPQIEEAWLWLSEVVSEPQERQICLENVLVINPANAHALKGLEQISQGTGGIPRFAPEAAEPSQAEHTAPLASDPSAYGDAIPTPPWPSGNEAALASNAAGPTPLPAWMQTDQAEASETGAHEAGNLRFGPADHQSNTWAAIGSEAIPEQPEQNDVLFGVPEWLSMVPSSADSSIHAEAQPQNGDGMTEIWANGSMPNADAERYNSQVQPGGHLPDEGNPDFRFEPFTFDDNSHLRTGSNAQVVGAEGAELPDWVRKHLNPPVESAPQEYAPAQDVQPAPGMFGDNFFNNANSYHDEAQGVNNNGSVYPDMPVNSPDLGPMGPYASAQLPSPDELPGEHSTGNPAQPWYLNSSNNSIASPTASSTGLPSYLEPPSDNSYDNGAHSAPREIVNIECPHCHEQVPDTSLACPQCRFNFFVNCPHCHELVDASDARTGQLDPCPHCGNPVDRMVLGVAVSPQERAAAEKQMLHQKDQEINYPSMEQAHVGALSGRSALSWLIDAVLLVAIAFIIWALTQFPTWYHLTGLYK